MKPDIQQKKSGFSRKQGNSLFPSVACSCTFTFLLFRNIKTFCDIPYLGLGTGNYDVSVT